MTQNLLGSKITMIKQRRTTKIEKHFRNKKRKRLKKKKRKKKMTSNHQQLVLIRKVRKLKRKSPLTINHRCLQEIYGLLNLVKILIKVKAFKWLKTLMRSGK